MTFFDEPVCLLKFNEPQCQKVIHQEAGACTPRREAKKKEKPQNCATGRFAV